MKAFFRVSIVVFCSLFILALSTAKPALAQINQSSLSNYTAADVNPDVPKDVHSLTQIVTTEVISTLICQLSGIDIMRQNQSCLGIDPKTHQIGFVTGGGGVIGATMTGIDFTFKIPVHSTDYIQYAAREFGITDRAYAQAPTGGVGFAGLQPLIGIWVAFRNIVYLFFVIIFVLIGIAIMLRVQIDPRTVMTLENQLPKIIIGIILVTFSYAIAGFLIDAMWLLTFLAVNVVAGTDKTNPTLTNIATLNLLNGPLGYINEVFSSNGFGGVVAIAGTAIHAVSDVLHNVISGTNSQQLGLMPTDTTNAAAGGGCDIIQGFFTFIGAPFNPLGAATSPCANQLMSAVTNQTVGSILLNIIGWFLGWILGALAGLVVLVALLITMFRVWFTLLQAYAYIILDIILAPFVIAAGLIPGSSIGFGSWLRGLASNLLVFPVTVVMFVLARVLFDAFYGGQTAIPGQAGGSLFQPPLIGSFNGSGTGNPLGAFIALAIIFATPAVLDVIRKALQVQDNGLGAAAMASVGAGGKAVGGTARRASNLFTAYKIDPLHATPIERVMSSIFR